VIVECQNCDTRFQLDDERVPIAGIRVRCSRCKEAFFLQHPETSQQQVIDEIASEALHDAAQATPEPATDLAGSSLDDLENFDAASVFDEDEDDWEFNHDVPDEDDAPEDVLGESRSANVEPGVPSGLELDSPEAASSAGSAAPPLAGGDPGASGSFGSVDDFGSLSESDDDGDSPPAALDAAPAATEDGDALSIGSSVESAVPRSAEPEVAADLGEPEDWDLLGEDAPAPQPAEQTEPIVFVPPALAEAGRRPAAATARRLRLPSDVGLGRFVQLAGSAVGWCLCAALATAALVQGLMSSAAPVTATTSYELASFRAESVTTRWTTVGAGETLLVVQGRLHNPTATAASLGLQVEVVLLDAQGEPLDHPGVLAGSPVPAAELRTLSPGARRLRLEAAAAALARERIAGSSSVSFEAVFEGLPAQARRVTILAVDALPMDLAPQAVQEQSATAPSSRS